MEWFCIKNVEEIVHKDMNHFHVIDGANYELQILQRFPVLMGHLIPDNCGSETLYFGYGTWCLDCIYDPTGILDPKYEVTDFDSLRNVNVPPSVNFRNYMITKSESYYGVVF